MILTGRPVSAEEAYVFGLANRVVAKGRARAEAEKLAHEVARFPQLCMTNDRISVYEQWDLDHNQGMINEFAHGTKSLASGQSREGAARFAGGRGRGGRFDDL
jgi:enoyl-CoA hydratase